MKVTTHLILVLGLLSMMMPLAVDMYLPAIPDIAADFQVSVGYVQFSLSIFMAGFAVGQILFGTLSDTYGRKPVIAGGLLAFMLLSFLAGLSPNLEFFNTVRGLHGFVSASVGVVINAMVRDRFEAVELVKTIALVGLVSNIAPLLAPLLGGWLHSWINWRAIFFALALISSLGFIIFCWTIPESLQPNKRQPFALRKIVHIYSVMIGDRNTILAIFASSCSFTGMFVFLILGSTVYRQEFGVGPAEFGWYFMLNILFMMSFNLLNSRLVGKWGSLTMFRLGLALQFGMGLVLILLALFASSHIFLAIGISIYVGALALTGANSMALVLGRFASTAGSASSLVGTVRFGMAALTGSVLAILFTTSLYLMVISMAVCGLAGSVAVLLIRVSCKES